MIRLSFIGNGLISYAHGVCLDALIRSGKINAIIANNFDPDGARASNFAQLFHSQQVESPQELIKNSDAIYILTPTKFHLDYITLAAPYQVPIFIEKPLATNLNDALKIEEIIKSNNLKVQVGLVLRTSPLFLQLRDFIDTKRFGHLMAINLTDDQFFPIQGHYASSWRSQYDLAGGGTLIEHSIHDIDILYFLNGPIQSAKALISAFSEYQGIEDSAGVLLRHSNRSISTITSVWHKILSRPSTRNITAFFEDAIVSFGGDFVGTMQIISDKETFNLEVETPEIIKSMPELNTKTGLLAAQYAQENYNFVTNITEDKPLEPTIDDAIYSHKIINQLYLEAKDLD